MSSAGVPPQQPVEIPKAVRHLLANDTIETVWRNELGGTTFKLTGRNGVRYLKWQDYSTLRSGRRHVNLHAEAERLAWAAQFAPVPEVLEFSEVDDAAWLLTSGVQGLPALPSHWETEPETAVSAIASGLRQLHDALPVETCPFLGGWAEHEGVELPAPEQLVVCHGDPCVPNTLIDAAGKFVAHVDLGMLGVADRWADLAIATYSISWKFNFGRA